MLVVAIHDCLGDQGIEFGITERRHPRRMENRLRRFTSNRRQRTAGQWFACKIKLGRTLHHANRPIILTGDPLPGRLASSRHIRSAH
jgi:hypothetical protein